MELVIELDLGDLRLRTLTTKDAALLVEATPGRALWGVPARPDLTRSRTHGPPCGRGTRSDTDRSRSGYCRARDWWPRWGLMLDGPHSAELAYLVRPEKRRRGIDLRSVEALALTTWAHDHAGFARVWLEIDPDNTPSLRLAQRAGYRLEQRLPRHCRAWISDDPAHDRWHDCLIWTYTT